MSLSPKDVRIKEAPSAQHPRQRTSRMQSWNSHQRCKARNKERASASAPHQKQQRGQALFLHRQRRCECHHSRSREDSHRMDIDAVDRSCTEPKWACRSVTLAAAGTASLTEVCAETKKTPTFGSCEAQEEAIEHNRIFQLHLAAHVQQEFAMLPQSRLQAPSLPQQSQGPTRKNATPGGGISYENPSSADRLRSLLTPWTQAPWQPPWPKLLAVSCCGSL